MPELSTIIGDKLEITGPVGSREFNVTDYAATPADLNALDAALTIDIAAVLAAANEADDTADAAQATANTALANATTALTAANAADDKADHALFLLGTTSATVRHLYWDPVDGSDANDGLSTATPVASAAALFALLPMNLDQPTLVHMTSGTFALGTEKIPYRLGSRLLWFHGDDTWNPRGDLYSVQLSGTSLATSSSSAVVTTGLVANAYRDMMIRYTSGPAAGQMRTVRGNTTTTITPCAPFSPAPNASGDTFEIFVSNALITWIGSAAITTDSTSATKSCGIVFSCVDFSGPASTHVLLGQGHYQFFGCRVRSTGGYTIVGQGRCAIVAGGATTDLVSQFGIPVVSWAGFGLGLVSTTASIGISTSPNTTYEGHYVSRATSLFAGGSHTLNGGFFGGLRVTGGIVTCTGANTNTKVQIGDTTDTGTKVFCETGGVCTLNTNTDIRNTSATNPLCRADTDGIVNVNATSITGENADAAGLSMRARGGGRVYIRGAIAPVLGKASGATADWACEATTAAASTLNALGAGIRDPAKPESVIVRTA